MSEHPNVGSIRTALEAFMRGDVERVGSLVAEDAVWHVPGKHRFSGDFRGRAEIMGRFQKQADSGVRVTFEELHDVVGGGDHVVALLTLRAVAPGGETSQRSVQVYHMRDGMAAEAWFYNEDQPTIDAVIGG